MWASIEYRCAQFCLTFYDWCAVGTFSFAVFFCFCFFVHLILLHAFELPITLVLDSENKIQTKIIFRFIQFLIQVGLHTYMGHIIDAIATKHLLCITELNLRYLTNFGSYDVMIWLAQSTDNSKWFAWSPRLWVNESGLYNFLFMLLKHVFIAVLRINKLSAVLRFFQNPDWLSFMMLLLSRKSVSLEFSIEEYNLLTASYWNAAVITGVCLRSFFMNGADIWRRPFARI